MQINIKPRNFINVHLKLLCAMDSSLSLSYGNTIMNALNIFNNNTKMILRDRVMDNSIAKERNLAVNINKQQLAENKCAPATCSITQLQFGHIHKLASIYVVNKPKLCLSLRI